MQRLLWASTSTKDPTAPDTLYVTGLAAPFTVNTMPDETLESVPRPRRRSTACSRPTAATPTRSSPSFADGRRRREGARGPAAGRRRPVVRRLLARPAQAHRRPDRRRHLTPPRFVTGQRERTMSMPERARCEVCSMTASRRCGSDPLGLLEAHHAEIAPRHLRELFADDPGRGERLHARGRRAVPRLLEAPGHRRDAAACSSQLAEESELRDAHRRDVPRRPHQRLRGPRGAARRAAHAEGHVARGRRRRRRRRGARGARPHGGVRRAACARASGWATPASASATSSTSASAAPTSAR